MVSRTGNNALQMLGGSRRRVLGVLREARRPIDVQEVVQRVGLHANTVRFHLDGLVEAGLAKRGAEDRTRPGRPRTTYAAAVLDDPSDQRGYRLLANMLTGYVATEVKDPAAAARRTGRDWGRYLAGRPTPAQNLDAHGATEQVVRRLADVGFAPEAVEHDGATQVLMRHCPFLETAERHSNVVCSLHLGLMQGMLAETGAPVHTDRLEPFVEPSLCIAYLAMDGTGKHDD
ncbi:putative ArsR family transcriptional regulator [Antricoccus suffuscus]|uniref:Putative ArsR family transcriptional regulator n=1 Tax=Antricoccus suffuscus TaxID=1629062 RepID=A0A2T1A752_9ACTN|nr:helix-turn-helix domain-containing protein [Antricoccus suffuscus]PRZ44158.1 putative ArsR family transcriptional regulator [Antricoccus suffuscus]